MLGRGYADGGAAGITTCILLQGYDSFVQNHPGQLQSHRARLHQQISRELRMRAGAENLYR